MGAEEPDVLPKRPQKVSVYAESCLLALSAGDLGRNISIGGAFALAYYLEYRPTHDVDAWWEDAAGSQERHSVLNCVRQVLSGRGETRTRSWGDVVSVNLYQEGRAVFSFQIASRDARLAPSIPAPWPEGLLLDSLRDLVAAKMKALVERGAPRDFRDIHALCAAGMLRPGRCWDLWMERARKSGIHPETKRARLALETHLARLELQRPLDKIEPGAVRESAANLRKWFRTEFLDALVD